MGWYVIIFEDMVVVDELLETHAHLAPLLGQLGHDNI